MYRNTYAEINLKNIEENIKIFKKKYPDYKYYFGVVKADCYGHYDIKTVKSIIKGGCNYLCVSSLDEAVSIRKKISNIPILCLGIIDLKHLNIIIKNNITITISNLDYLKELLKQNHKGIKVHLKIDTGMHRLGFSNKEELLNAYKLIINSDLILEGIYTHIYDPLSKERTLKQYAQFEKITTDIDLTKIPIVHMGASDATMNYEKRKYANGCRLGIIMYGLADTKDKDYKSTFSLYSEVIELKEVCDETVGYSGKYLAKGKKRIAVVSIGYADGIIRKNTGREVYINNKPYKIIGNICMDMLFVKVDENVKVTDKVTIIKDIDHIYKIAKHLDTITWEVICNIGKRVPRKYINK